MYNRVNGLVWLYYLIIFFNDVDYHIKHIEENLANLLKIGVMIKINMWPFLRSSGFSSTHGKKPCFKVQQAEWCTTS